MCVLGMDTGAGSVLLHPPHPHPTLSLTAGDFRTAAKLHRDLLPLVKAMFIETNPVPVKASLAAMGLCHRHVRLPLVHLEPGSSDKLTSVLEAAAAAGGLGTHHHKGVGGVPLRTFSEASLGSPPSTPSACASGLGGAMSPASAARF